MTKYPGKVSSLLPIVNELGALPGLELQELFTFLVLILIASLRVGAFLISAPFFGGRMVPLQIRIVFSFCLGFWILGTLQFPQQSVLVGPKLILIVMQEIFIGLTVGLVLNICFAAVSLAGEKIAATSGLAFASQVDPTGGGQSPVISQIFMLFLIVVFFSVNGHLIVLGLIYKSFALYPLGQLVNYGDLIAAGLSASDILFRSAAIIVLPIVIVLLFVNIAIGFITKSAPQLNLFSFGFPMTLIGAFLILFYSVDAISFAFKDLIQLIIDLLMSFLLEKTDG
ncbi:flagellar biosynthetic protein FliR [Planktomarina temperata]|nr:flagellar biosynthetic protein FliR [Planktomarina temperata]MDA9349982.1 flagellar biosynthetic protein FliR [bacterium]MDA9205867.1 flagellar biosynthetic protein FliR [Planktomarina temperata]MDB0024027.1 flagellar biosynthetic protein FliR [bacterium]MDB0035297.1 flagellar biosynthetic protein FliR [Planktomarina temperata]